MGNIYKRTEPLHQPLLPEQLIGFHEVDVIVEIDLGDIIAARGIEHFNEIADEKVHGFSIEGLLADINYCVVGHKQGKEHDYGAVLVRVQALIERH